jgi:hypothetical protein
MNMKYTISERTVTIETTQPGEALNRETVQALTERKTTADYIERLALAAPETKVEKVEIDEAYDPLEDLNYTDVSPEVLANEELANMTPANFLAAE